MASISQWKSAINNNNKEYTGKVKNFDDLSDFFIKNNMRVITSNNQLFHSPVYTTINSLEDEKSVKLFTNAKIEAVRGTNYCTITAKVGRALNASDNIVKTGALFIPPAYVIAGVAEACGYSIGWDIAEQIYEDVKNWSDWGTTYTTHEGIKQIFAVVTIENNKLIVHIEERLIKIIITALDMWGLWNPHPAITPLEPQLHDYVKYNFAGRFPAIPQQYVERTQQLFDNFVMGGGPDWWDKYMSIAIDTEDDITMTILDFSAAASIYRDKMNIWYRNPDINNSSHVFSGGDTILTCQADKYQIFQYEIKKDGTMSVVRESDVLSGSFTFKTKAGTRCTVYDLFGATIRNIDEQEGKIGGKVVSFEDVHVDYQAVDLRHGEFSTLLPSWWAERIIVSVPDASQWGKDYVMASYLNETEEFLPLHIPNREIDDTSTQSKGINGEIDDDIVEETLDELEDIVSDIGVEDDVLEWQKPTNSSPIPTLPNGLGAGNFISLYKLDDTKLTSFAQYLWSGNLVTNLEKLYSDPMEAIIGCHAVFSNPTVASTGKVWVGNCDSGVNADIIHQFKTLDCGTKHIPKTFNNVNDYINTQLQLYLPFIGFVDLTTEDVMGRDVNVKYQLDYLTGACLAIVSVIDSDAHNPINIAMYQYSGNFVLEIPLSAGGYADVLRNGIMAAFSVQTAAMHAAGYDPRITKAHTNAAGTEAIGNVVGNSMMHVQRSGGIGGNAGCMGIRKPYILITRKKAFDANNRGHYEGLPQNANVKLSSQRGYTRVKYINLEGLPCTEREKQIILNKLQGGVIL